MATLNPTLTLAGTAADFGAAISLSVTDQLTVAGDLVGISRAPTGTISSLLTSTKYGASYIYLKNADAAINITITVGSQTLCVLKPLEFAYLPWDGTADIKTTAASGAPIIEYALFEA